MSAYETYNLGSFVPSASLYVKLAYTAALRAMFLSPLPGYEDFTFSDTAPNTKIKIYRGYPKSFVMFPTLLVLQNSIDYSLRYLNEEFYEDVWDSTTYSGMTISAPLSMDVAIEIYARSEEDRERLTDYICFVLRTKFLRDVIGDYGIIYKDITVGRESTEKINNEPIFRNTITTKNKVEYSLFVTPEFMTNVQAIQINLQTVLSKDQL